MEDHLLAAKVHLRLHLEENGFPEHAIRRVLDEDFQYLTEWRPHTHSLGVFRSGQAIVSFAFGFGPLKNGVGTPPDPKQYHPDFNLPGKSNEGLARQIHYLYSRYGVVLPTYTQWEIGEALKEHAIFLPPERIARPGQGYLGTSGVVDQWLENGLGDASEIILVAQPYHVFRCKKTLEKVFADKGKPIEVLVADTSTVPFDKDSVQPWTRSLTDWVNYEVGNRFSNRFRGLIDKQ